MGRNYFCDYCQRSFSDTANNRRKHLQSAYHQRTKKEHYDSFKDALTVLNENAYKNPCRKFFENGYCEYGSRCRYSHLTSQDREELLKKVEISNKPKVELSKPSLGSWISKQKNLRQEENIDDYCFELPNELRNRGQLPPSLLPYSALDFRYVKLELASWGNSALIHE